MIRVLVVDDHPAVLNGVVGALRSEPGIVPVATAGGSADALGQARRGRIDVALVDFHLPDGDGLNLCHDLKQLRSAPAVVVYSAFTEEALRLAAAVAGADGVVDKSAPLHELYDAIRAAARGERSLPRVRPGGREPSLARLETEDLPFLAMRLDGAALGEIASVLGLSEREVTRRVRAIVERLTGPETPGYMERAAYLGAATD